jgi:Acyl-protein synthetase, LuxE
MLRVIMSFGCRGKPAANKYRMNKELSNFTARLRFATARQARDNEFNELGLELFALQFKYNSAYRKICEARKLTPQVVEHWTQIPFVPTSAFKELELTSLAPDERTAVFHSSGTTEQKPSRHFHCAESLELYVASLWKWFEQNVLTNLRFTIYDLRLICLTPPPVQAPHSSLVHMFETIRRKLNFSESVFVGKISDDGGWALDFDAVIALLENRQSATGNRQLILGTAFSFVHLLDFLAEKNLRLQLPENSRVMETGGYKNRSRSLPKAELHSLIEEFLGVPRENIICEYGMSELSSQAYDFDSHHPSSIIHHRVFRFPPWARAQIVSPESGREVRNGETGLIRIFDLANVFSVAAIQTEDLGIRRDDGFELVGRAQFAEPRGCSLMTA